MDKSKEQWLVHRAKELRKNQTPQEIEFWRIIRAKRFEGLKFYRQYIIDSYIVDFCCPEKMLVVELDGGGHADSDEKRDKYLRRLGYRVIRVWNNELINYRNDVLEIIAEVAKTPLPASGHPPPGMVGGEKSP